MRWPSALLVAVVTAAVGCGDESASCVVPPCGPAEPPPTHACPSGSDPDVRGCVPILPLDPCGAGELGLPGETSCRPVAPCDGSRWGVAPVAATTQYVDAAYSGGASLGTESAPWTTIGQAIAAASDDAVIVIAAGSYPEALVIDKPVALWGSCPAEVSIAVDGQTAAALVTARGAELHTLTVSNANGAGVRIEAGDVLLSQMWVRQTVIGIELVDSGEALLRDSLIEDSLIAGVTAIGAQVRVERTLLRGGRVRTDGGSGIGVGTLHIPAFDPTGVVLDGCLIESVPGFGVLSGGGEIRLEGTAVRRILANADGQYGDGATGMLLVEDATNMTAGRGDIHITGSWISETARVGVSAFGSETVIADSALECNPIHINGERVDAVAVPLDFDITDGDGNVCGCGDERVECQVLSAGLRPPEPPGS